MKRSKRFFSLAILIESEMTLLSLVFARLDIEESLVKPTDKRASKTLAQAQDVEDTRRDGSTETTYASLASRILRVSRVFVYFFLVRLLP